MNLPEPGTLWLAEEDLAGTDFFRSMKERQEIRPQISALVFAENT